MGQSRGLAVKTTIHVKAGEGRISLWEGDTEAGYLFFELVDKRLLRATHTVVSPEYQGQGLARQLVDSLIVWASERSLLIEPVCSYVVRIAQRDEALARLTESHSQAEDLIQLLVSMGDAERSKACSRYFKTGKGQYGEGDVFLGISTPELRAILRPKTNPLHYRRLNLSIATLTELWQSPYHEARALGYMALADWAERASDTSAETIYQLYLEHAERCNNWDLVDCSAPQIIGRYWSGRDAEERRTALLSLAGSDCLWVQRIAIVGTLGLLRQGLYEDTLALAEALSTHKHDLIHKATGWLLREVGKRIDKEILTDWLEHHAPKLPRTALRYAIEHLTHEERKHFMDLR